MRASSWFVVLTLGLATNAHAEPAAAGSAATKPTASPGAGEPHVLPPIAGEALQPAPSVAGKPPQTGALAFGGGWAAGIILAPPPHADARPWPEGILIMPPDPGDPMAIGAGRDGLELRERADPDGWRALGQRIDRFWELVLPRSL